MIAFFTPGVIGGSAFAMTASPIVLLATFLLCIGSAVAALTFTRPAREVKEAELRQEIDTRLL